MTAPTSVPRVSLAQRVVSHNHKTCDQSRMDHGRSNSCTLYSGFHGGEFVRAAQCHFNGQHLGYESSEEIKV